ncbi:MAG: hypothetical protein ACFFAH_00820 [Promethearchaeota archaeon]
MANIFIFSLLALENGRTGELPSIELAAGLQEFHKISLIDTNRFIGEKLLSNKAIKKKLKGAKRSEQIKYTNLIIGSQIYRY